MSKSTEKATLYVEVVAYCPKCAWPVDLMEQNNEEGHIIEQACPGGDWGDAHLTFSVDDVACPECFETFDVKGLYWSREGEK